MDKLTIPPAKATLYVALPFLGLCSVALIWGMVTTCIIPAFSAPAGIDYLLLLISVVGFGLLLKVLCLLLNKLLQTKIFQVAGDELVVESKLPRFKPKQEKSLTLRSKSKITLTSRQMLGEKRYEAITGKTIHSDDETEFNIRYLLLLKEGDEEAQLIHQSLKLQELSPIFDWLHGACPTLEAENLLADENILAQHHAIKQASKKVILAFACVLISVTLLGYQWDASSDFLTNVLHYPIFAVVISIGLLVRAFIEANKAKFQ